MGTGAAQRAGLIGGEPGAVIVEVDNLLLQRADFFDIIQLLFFAFPRLAQALEFRFTLLMRFFQRAQPVLALAQLLMQRLPLR